MSSDYPSRFLPAVVTIFGFVLIIVAGCVGVSHFAYGNPIPKRTSNELNSSAAILFWVLMFGAAGLVVAGSGIAILIAAARRRRDRADE